MFNLCKQIKNSCITNSDQLFLQMEDESLTFGETLEQLEHRRKDYDSLGVCQNHIICISSRCNTKELIFSMLTCLYMGATCCILPKIFEYKVALAYDWLLTDRPLVASDLKAVAQFNELYLYKALCSPTIDPRVRKAALILPTSGTTGESKWICLEGRSLINTVNAIKAYMKTGQHDMFYAMKYLGHISSITSDLFLALFSGACLVVNTYDFNLKSILTQFDKWQPTVLTLVPTILKYLLRNELPVNLNSVRIISLVGASADDKLLRMARERIPHANIFVGYGLTEASSRLTFLPSERLLDKIGSIGIPIENVEIELRKDGRRISTPNTIGEIFAKSPGNMIGHVFQGVFYPHEEEYLETADLAYFDIDGFYYHCGRKDDIMVVDGMNISPIVIERQIAAIDDVYECCVFLDRQSKEYDQIVTIVQLKEGSALKSTDIHKLIRGKLHAQLMPKRILIVDEILKNTNGKISRKQLSDFYCGKDKFERNKINSG